MSDSEDPSYPVGGYSDDPTSNGLDTKYGSNKFIDAYSASLRLDPLFKQLDKNEMKSVVESCFTVLDDDGNGMVQSAELSVLTKASPNWKVLFLVIFAWVVLPITALYSLLMVCTHNHVELLRKFLEAWSEGTSNPFLLFTWAILDVYRLNVRRACTPVGRAGLAVATIVVVGAHALAFAIPVVYVASILFPEVIEPWRKTGLNPMVPLSRGATLIEAIFPVACFLYFASEVAVTFIIGRSAAAMRVRLGPTKKALSSLRLRMTRRNPFGAVRDVLMDDEDSEEEETPMTNGEELAEVILHQVDVLTEQGSLKIPFRLFVVVAPVFMSFSCAAVRAVDGGYFIGLPDSDAHKFVTIGALLSLYLVLMLYFALLVTVREDLLRGYYTSQLIDGLTKHDQTATSLKLLDIKRKKEVVVQPLALLQLNTPQNVAAFARLRSFFMLVRNVHMLYLNIVTGIVGSYVAWLVAMLIIIIFHYTFLDGILYSSQVKAFFAIVLFGTFIYALFAVAFMLMGVSANAAQMRDNNVVLDASADSKMKVHFSKSEEEKTEAIYTSELLYVMSKTIGSASEEVVRMFGVRLTPAIFGTLATSIVIAGSTCITIVTTPPQIPDF